MPSLYLRFRLRALRADFALIRAFDGAFSGTSAMRMWPFGDSAIAALIVVEAARFTLVIAAIIVRLRLLIFVRLFPLRLGHANVVGLRLRHWLAKIFLDPYQARGLGQCLVAPYPADFRLLVGANLCL